MADQVLLALLYHADLLKLVFTVGERKIASKQIEKLLKGDAANSGLSEMLKTIMAAACER